jgi:gamma-glutamyltranspeptidase/glutathione hydrolase
MLSRLLGELVPSFTLSHDQFEIRRMVTGAGTLMRWFAGLLTLQAALADYGTPSPPVLRDGQRGAVASESSICSHIGIDLLKLGGNAADAMVGTVACIGVVGMYHSGESDPIRHYCSIDLRLTDHRLGWWRLHVGPSTKRQL